VFQKRQNIAPLSPALDVKCRTTVFSLAVGAAGWNRLSGCCGDFYELWRLTVD
jgi:hypothetical protein